jgi:curli biogenesis system outer membrane secretion channel CsgG
MKRVLALCTICCTSIFVQSAKAQKTPDNQVRMEFVKEKCKDIPFDKRIRITVARFTSTAGNSPVTLGDNMSTMLSSALSQVNCFNVLEEQKNMTDITGEIDAANSEYIDASTGIEKGKMKSAQIIVTGEVTEYNEKETGVSHLGFGKTTLFAKIGFILKVINPRTREILKSTSFNVESKTGSVKAGIFSQKSNTNPAISDALEKGIIQATEYLAAEKDNIPLPSETELNSSLTMITVSNITFSQKSAISDLIKNTAGVKKVDLSKFSNNTAVYAVRHEGSTDDLAVLIDKKYSGRFEITGTSSGAISIKSK